MKQDQVRVGGEYTAKVSGKAVTVRITEEKWLGDRLAGWVGVNTQTGRPVRIKSAQRLRRAVGGATPDGAEAGAGSPRAAPPAPVATGANVGGDVGNDGGALVKAGNPKRGAKSAAKPSKDAEADAKPAKVKSTKAKSAEPAKQTKAPKPAKPKRLSCLDAAAIVLADSGGTPMRATELIAEITRRGLWSSPIGKTPEATLYAAIIREIAAKGKDSRFKKHDRGLFVSGKGA